MTKDTIIGIIGGLIVLGILLKEKVVEQGDALMLAAVIVTNTVYEIFLVFLMSYGLVEFPRLLWNMADYNFYLLSTQMVATSDYKAISDYMTLIQEDIRNIHYCRQLVCIIFTSSSCLRFFLHFQLILS